MRPIEFNRSARLGRGVLPALAALSMLAIVGCDDDDPASPDPQSFTVTIENVSVAQTLETDRADGVAPISPGAWAVFTGDNPMFTAGGMSDAAMESLAEEGDPAALVAVVNADDDVRAGGMFTKTSGTGPLATGDMATFTFNALPGDRLQIATMFGQSNDWFYAFGDGGLELFDDDTPVSGNVTSSIVLYDAGTEEDTAPGTGPDQKPAQPMGEVNIGPADDDTTIRTAGGFTIPPTASVIKVTITAN